MSLNRVPLKDMFLANNNPRQAEGGGLDIDHTGQQLHVSGVFIILLELVLVVENLFPILVVALWLPAPARGVGDRLVAAFSVTCILSALVPTPLGLASYFSGDWYGGAPTCTTYQVTSIWCNLSSLVLLTYMCINCHIAVRRLAKLKPPERCPSCHRSVLTATSSASESTSGHLSSQHRQTYEETSAGRGSENWSQQQLQLLEHPSTHLAEQEVSSHCNGVKKSRHKLSLGTQATPIVLGYAENSLVDLDSEDEVRKFENTSSKRSVDETVKENGLIGKTAWAAKMRNTNAVDMRNYSTNGGFAPAAHSPLSPTVEPDVLNSQLAQTSRAPSREVAFQQTGTSLVRTNSLEAMPSRSNICSSLDQHYGPESRSNILGAGECHTRDYVSLALFFLFSITLGVSSLPVAGLGPSGMPQGDTSCRSWLVPTPVVSKERVFFVAFLTLVYLCLLLGCGSGICVCLQVSKRMKQERRRKTRLYHEEENVPDLGQLYALDCMRRHYSMACIVMAGILTWVPSALMLTLQKSGVEVSEPTLMYSNIATSLPGLLNPLLYSLALARYRTGYKALIEKCCCKRRKLKPQLMKRVHTTIEGPPSATTSVEVTIDPAGQRHLCLHGTTNPTFNSELDQLLQVDEEDDLEDDEIEEDDEDYFPESSDDPDQEKDNDTIKAERLRVTERTPLHAVSMATSGAGQAFRTVLANRSNAYRHGQRDGRSMNIDKDELLLSNSVKADDETGL